MTFHTWNISDIWTYTIIQIHSKSTYDTLWISTHCGYIASGITVYGGMRKVWKWNEQKMLMLCKSIIYTLTLFLSHHISINTFYTYQAIVVFFSLDICRCIRIQCHLLINIFWVLIQICSFFFFAFLKYEFTDLPSSLKD